jgi:hypothetical protein
MLTIETANEDVDEAEAAKHLGLKPGQYVLLTISDVSGEPLRENLDPVALLRVAGLVDTVAEKIEPTGHASSICASVAKGSSTAGMRADPTSSQTVPAPAVNDTATPGPFVPSVTSVMVNWFAAE